MRLVRN